MIKRFITGKWYIMAKVEIIILFVFTLFAIICTLSSNIYNFNTSLRFRCVLLPTLLIILVTAALLSFTLKKLGYLKHSESENYQRTMDSIQGNLCNNSKSENRKLEFFTNIYHDLKTPLTVILGTIQLIENQNHHNFEGDCKSKKHHIVIKHNCYRLLKLVNNILDISRIDSGHFRLNTTNINIVYLIEEIVQSVIPYGEQKGIYIEFDTESEEIITAVDIDKIERIILNLLSNAIKFTPRNGTIKVRIYSSMEKVLISIKDSGPGIPKNKMNIIFERFKQINTSLTRDFEGSGIGLSLVKSFVDLHGGEITVNSNGKTGSEFLVSLPVRTCSENKYASSLSSNSQSRIIEAINIEFSDIYSAAP